MVWSTVTGHAVGSALQPATSPGGASLGIAFSSNGRSVAVVYPQSVVVWDTVSGTKIAEIRMTEQSTTAGIALSPDGNTVAVDGADVRLWDLHTGRLIGAPIRVAASGNIAFSPDGSRVAYDEEFSYNTNVHVRDLAHLDSDRISFAGPNYLSSCLAFSPDGHKLAIGADDGSLQLWNTDTGKPAGPRMTGHAGTVDDIAFSPDGARLATAGQDKTIREWDTATGYPLTGPNQVADFVRFAPDGRELISLSADATVRRWDAMTGSGPLALGGPLNPAGIAIDPQGTDVATGGIDGLQVWDYATGKRVAAVPVKDGVQSVSYAPDGKSIVIVTILDGHVMVWDGTTLRPVTLAPSVGAAATAAFMPAGLPFMPTGREIAVGTVSGKLLLEDIDKNLNGKPGATIPTGCPVGHIAISKDGTHMAFNCSNSHKLFVADGHKKSIRAETPPAAVDAMAFSADGNTLIIGTSDGVVYRRDGSTGDSNSVGAHRSGIAAIAYSPDGRFFASAGDDGTVVVYPATSTLISARLTAYSDPVAALAFAPDSSHLIAFGQADSAAQIWHVFPDPGTELCDRTPYNLNRQDWGKWVSAVLGYQLSCVGKPQQPNSGS